METVRCPIDEHNCALIDCKIRPYCLRKTKELVQEGMEAGIIRPRDVLSWSRLLGIPVMLFCGMIHRRRQRFEEKPPWDEVK